MSDSRPRTLHLLKMMYWRLMRRPAELPHLTTALMRSLLLFAKLCLRAARPPIRPTVTIALTEHMGDIVAAEPIAREARKRFPSASIRWIVRSGYRALPDQYEDVNETIPVHCLTEWLLAWSFGVHGTIWDLHISGRACPHCQVTFEKPDPTGAVTFKTYFRLGNLLTSQCRSAGLVPITDAPRLGPDEASAAAVNRLGLPADYIVLHCVSNETRKDWAISRWDSLTRRLMLDHGVFVVEIGLTPHAVASDGPHCRGLCGQLSLLESAEVIRRARLFVGIDSGPAHLANAVRTPGVLLLGPYAGFDRYMPYSGFYQNEGGARMIWGEPTVASIDVDTVLEAVLECLR
jgi:heptosyltransferase-3